MSEKVEQGANFNPQIEDFLSRIHELEIDESFAYSEFGRYLNDMVALQSGAKFKDLRIEERRRNNSPRLILAEAPGGQGDSLVDDMELWFSSVGRWSVPKDSIALFPLTGVMRSESFISSPGMDSFVNDLRRAYDHPNIKGIIIESRSGGGESMAGQMLRAAIEERNKPVIATGHFMASAAYRGLSPADEVWALSDSAEFGSIGTMTTVDMKMVNKYRERYMEVYSKDSPEKNADHRGMMSGDFSKLQKTLDDMTARFQSDVKTSRKLQGDADTIKKTLSGAMFPAPDAKRRGLIDGVGNLKTAIRRVNFYAKNFYS